MKKKPNGYWSFDRCKIEALKYSQRSKFEKGCGSAYIAAMRKGWLDLICSHMKSPQKKSGYWTQEKCINEAKKYLTATEFENGSPGAYDAARRHGIYEECCRHMRSPQKTKGYWTKKRCLSEAKKYKTRSDFFRSCCFVYLKCRQKGWFEDACRHMDRPKSDADIFYIWKTSHKSENGNPIYKIGVTSERLGFARIKQCTSSLSSDYSEVIFYGNVGNAISTEKEVKKIGRPWRGVSGNGYTELREMNGNDLSDAIMICKRAQKWS